jgi:hypothetical protein
MVNLKVVELHYEHTIFLEAFIFRTAVSAHAAEQLLIPATTGFNISHCY